jgi:hypothetical protein
MRMKAVGLVLVLVGLATVAAADESRSVGAGDKVRLTLGERRFSAVVVEAEGDALVVRTGPDAAATRVPLADLTRLQRASGRRGHVKEGALIGFVPGFLFGAWVGGALGCDDQGPGCSALPTALAVGGVTGGATAVAGALIGLAVRGDRWVDVPVARSAQPRTSVALVPVRGGAAARFALSF